MKPPKIKTLARLQGKLVNLLNVASRDLLLDAVRVNVQGELVKWRLFDGRVLWQVLVEIGKRRGLGNVTFPLSALVEILEPAEGCTAWRIVIQ
jgi:hypothetical protein